MHVDWDFCVFRLKLQLNILINMHKSISLFLFFAFFYLSTINANAQLIKNVIIIDGSGAEAYSGSVRIKGNIIIGVGQLKPVKGEIVIDGKGQVIAPGFIDSHSHHFSGLMQDPTGLANASQGVTTIVIGQDGDSYLMDSLTNKLQKRPIAINVATYTGHATLRELVMGEKNVLRKATQKEINKMKAILTSDMQKGSFGLATGLEYEQSFYSSKEEVIDLAKIAALYNGRYMSHIRSEDIALDEAIEEIINIGKLTKMPVQIAHIKIGIKERWNTASEIIKKLEVARKEGVEITADVYPYNFWNSTLRVLFAKRDYENLESAQFAVDQVFDANESYLVHFAPMPHYKGMTIAAIAQERNQRPAQTIIDLIKMTSAFKIANPNFKGRVEAIAAKGMSEKDVASFLKWEHSNICSDGADGGHPRGYGSFTKVLGKYTREEKLFSLETAIFKMTGLTAKHLGIKDRGQIKNGYKADLVLFDPNNVKDNASIENGKAISSGINMVWVNGKLVYQYQQTTGDFPGILIKRNK